MHFNGQNRKKWRKRTPIIFRFYMKICPPTFSGPPLGWENDIFSKNRLCLIWRHISPEPLTRPECKNIGLTLWPIRKTSFWFGGHVLVVWQTNEGGANKEVVDEKVEASGDTREDGESSQSKEWLKSYDVCAKSLTFPSHFNHYLAKNEWTWRLIILTMSSLSWRR